MYTKPRATAYLRHRRLVSGKQVEFHEKDAFYELSISNTGYFWGHCSEDLILSDLSLSTRADPAEMLAFQLHISHT